MTCSFWSVNSTILSPEALHCLSCLTRCLQNKVRWHVISCCAGIFDCCGHCCCCAGIGFVFWSPFSASGNALLPLGKSAGVADHQPKQLHAQPSRMFGRVSSAQGTGPRSKILQIIPFWSATKIRAPRDEVRGLYAASSLEPFSRRNEMLHDGGPEEGASEEKNKHRC
jgi:hypothetical protein